MIRNFAFLLGFAFLGAGFLGFIPALVLHDAGTPGSGLLFGLLPVSPLLNGVHVALGVICLVLSGQYRSAITCVRAATVVLTGLALLGAMPLVTAVPGLAPLALDVTWTHGVLAVITAYFGWGEPSRSYIRLL